MKTESFQGYKIHSLEVCKKPCPFHAPSEHPLNEAPIHIRADKKFLAERICEHGVGHDDPDSVAYFHSKGEAWAGVHGCDGCCTNPKEVEMITRLYRYDAKLLRIVDGDTVEVVIDLGFRLSFQTAIRLAYINAPEMSTEEGKIAKAYLIEIAQPNLIVESKKNPRDKYGRWLGVLYNPTDEKSINDLMVESGNAVYGY